MRSFTAYFKKEIAESWSTYRYLILGLGFTLFGIATPILLKSLPYFLDDTIPRAAMEALTNYTPKQVVQNYMSDIYQISNLFMVFTLMNIVSAEITDNKLVFPFSKGVKIKGMVLSKFVHYTLTVVIFLQLGLLFDVYYANLLFDGNPVSYLTILNAGFILSLYFMFTLALLFLISSLTLRGMVAGIGVLLFNFISPVLLMIPALKGFIPHTLVNQANMFSNMQGSLLNKSIIISSIYIIVLLWLTIWRIRKVEIV